MNLPEGVKGYECKLAHYTEANDGSRNDVVLVKRNIHMDDGSVTPDLKFVYNHKKEFFITRPNHRVHQEKKAWEFEHKVQRFTSTQAYLVDNIAKALGRSPQGMNYARICKSPYVYGADITPSATIKKMYMDRWPELTTASTVAVCDIETDVVNGDGEIIISTSLTYGDHLFLGYTKEFTGGVEIPEAELTSKFSYYMNGIADDLEVLIANPETSEERRAALKTYVASLRHKATLKVTAKLCSTPAMVVQWIFQKAHETRPDFVAFWNMNFDFPKMTRALEREGIDPRLVYCEPSLPDQFKNFRYIEGQAIKKTATGKTMSKHPSQLWHVVEAPASFYCIDAMCVFKQVRVTEANRNSYGLDAILKDELDLGKLKFKEADHLGGLEWHVFMQTRYKLEYLIYNLFDCVSIEILDDKTKDLALTIPVLCGHSDYAKFPSTPRRLCDDLHYFLKPHKMVISTTSNSMVEELDEHVVNMNNWIVTLPSHLCEENGLKIVEENPNLSTLIRTYVADLDVSSSYPSTGISHNISMETTLRELSGVGDIPEMEKRLAGLNLTAARTNAVECAGVFFNFPTPSQLLAEYNKQNAI